MDFERNLTSRDFLKALTNQSLIGYNELTPEKRYAQARWAQRCRNFFFTASVPVPTVVPAGNVFPDRLLGATPRFSEAVIVTDALSMVDRGAGATAGLSPLLQCFDVGGENAAYGDDFFGLSGPVPQEFLLKHERNVYVGVGADRPAKWLGFVPRLLRPYQTIATVYTQVPKNYPQLQIGFRALRVLAKDNPYQYLTTDADNRLRNYIAGNDPETFFMDVTAPMINVRNSVGNPTVRRTEPMDRPLLILSAVSNAQGIQGKLYDESKQYRFDFPDIPLNITQVTTAPYKAVPLNLWAPNSDMFNPEMVNIFPVPHFLAPGAVLRVELTNGLAPDATGFTQDTTTRGEEDVRVTFVCRTV